MKVDTIKSNEKVTLESLRARRTENLIEIDKLTKVKSDIKRCAAATVELIKKLERNNTVNQSLLESLQKVSAKHGENATVRLKNDHFKYGQASNFFKNIIHSGRYQTEREAAVKKINAEESTVSAGKVIKTLQEKNDSYTSEIDKLKTEFAGCDKNIETIKANIHKLNEDLILCRKGIRERSKPNKKNDELRQIFSMIYQTNAGCKDVNIEARYLFGNATKPGNVSGSKVIEEYRGAHGRDIFSRGNSELKSTIKVYCDDLRNLVKASAEEWYTPTRENMVTYRGQGMTKGGFNTLFTRFNADKNKNTNTVYKLGQFFSTTLDKDIASDFAKGSKDDIKVIFEVDGNSGSGLFIPGGLTFVNHEREGLYSPLAKFTVKSILPSKKLNNTYHVALKEVTKEVTNDDSTLILPY